MSFAGATGRPLDLAAIFGARSHYAVLGLEPSAEAQEVRHAFRQVSLRVHPDKVQSLPGDPDLVRDAEAAFKLVSAAYEVLSDAGRRAAYDRSIGLRKAPTRKKPAEEPSADEPHKAAEPPWISRAPKKPKEETHAEAKETICLTVSHAVFGHEIKVSVNKGLAAFSVKKTLSKMVKRGPPDRIEFCAADGTPIDNDFAFSQDERLFSVGLSLGPPRLVKVAITDWRTSVCRTLAVLDTCNMLQLAREVAKAVGAPKGEVEVGRLAVSEDGLTEFERHEERELLNGRRRFWVRRNTLVGLFHLTAEEAGCIQDDLIAAYSLPEVQAKLDVLFLAHTELGVEFHKVFYEIVDQARRHVLVKWGFDVEGGLLHMCGGIHRHESLPEIHARSVRIGQLLRGVSREAWYLPKGQGQTQGQRMPPHPGPSAWDDPNYAPEGYVLPGLEPVEAEASHAQQDQASPGQPQEPSASGLNPSQEHKKGQIWKIVGGEDKGGILVREACDLESPFVAERLSHGAFVSELELVSVEGVGERLRFKRLSGSGPREGWISVALSHKDLAERIVATEEWAKTLGL